ncbi:DUF7341 domain-containing protein [Agromyces cerinus]|uniref:DUF7341 domain-containing protein n=1 Tax=Agromyces cerinus subsp. cerinus TaxID=232089 RepID=A0A1N6DPE7_9MICO|nr:hypothetical protein [Agromyces cerinus]SIN72672.1 hypothetical protein SAMN05443544_0560 [Agromyces cerinus subsp. cerinus]
MSTELDVAVEKLTRPWSDVVTIGGEYKHVNYDPLLDMLAKAKTSSLGRTASGRSSQEARNPFNIPAFDLWERIDGQTRAWLREFGRPAPRDLREAVTVLHKTLAELWSGQRIQESLFLRLSGVVARWVPDIWALFHPVDGVALDGACPNCEAEWVINFEGAQTRALVSVVEAGEPGVRCRNGCGWEVSGKRQTIEFALRLGATPDLDELGREDER